MDKHNRILASTKKKLEKWKRYIEYLFEDDRSSTHDIDSNDDM